MTSFICGLSVLVIASANPIHALLQLIGVFTRGTGLLFSSNMDYYARLFLIVYIGAIVVLFLFVIIILEVSVSKVEENLDVLVSSRTALISVFLGQLMLISRENDVYCSSTRVGNLFTNFSTELYVNNILSTLGAALYSDYEVSIIIVAVLLTRAIIGAIAVTSVQNQIPTDTDTTSFIPFETTKKYSIYVSALKITRATTV